MELVQESFKQQEDFSQLKIEHATLSKQVMKLQKENTKLKAEVNKFDYVIYLCYITSDCNFSTEMEMKFLEILIKSYKRNYLNRFINYLAYLSFDDDEGTGDIVVVMVW